MDRRGRRSWAPWAVASLVVAAGLYVASRYLADPAEAPKRKTSEATPTAKRSWKISLVVSKSLLDSGIPLGPLLSQFSEMVVVLAPDFPHQSSPQLQAQIPPDLSYKIIPCETQIGVVHVLKHLRADLVVLPNDIPETVPIDIQRFVGKIKVLSGDLETASSELHSLFFA